MNGYFKPLRRKVGVLMLAMACPFSAGWVRSYLLSDRFCHCQRVRGQFFGGNHQHLLSTYGQLWWSQLLEQQGQLNCKWHYSFKSVSDLTFYEPKDGIWRWKVGEFEFGEFTDVNIGQTKYLIIPYWSIVVPLTLLSAWLLLSKPRPSRTTGNRVQALREQNPSEM